MNTNQKSAVADKPAKSGKSKTHTLPKGTVSGPKGKKLVDVKPEADDHKVSGEAEAVKSADNVNTGEVTESAEVPLEQREGERRQAASDLAMQFSAQQLSVPAAHGPELQTPPALIAEFNAKVKELAASMGITTPAPAIKAPKADKHQKNGITRPSAASTCGKIWAVADEISHTNSIIAPIGMVKAHKDLHGVNEHTVKTQYARWRQYNGVKGRLPTIAKEAPVVGSGVVMNHEGAP